jgi:hypothetical protein
MSEDIPRQKLCEIIACYGQSVCEDPRKCEALLRDFCGEHRREIHALVNALREKIAEDLLAASEGVPRNFLVARLARRLQDNLGLDRKIAVWTVESWGLALGRLSNDDLKTEPERRTRKRRPKAVALVKLPDIWPEPIGFTVDCEVTGRKKQGGVVFFSGRAGQRVTITMNKSNESARLDPFLILVGPDETVKEDDDGGGDLNVRIDNLGLPSSGMYVIMVTSADAYDSNTKGRENTR